MNRKLAKVEKVKQLEGKDNRKKMMIEGNTKTYKGKGKEGGDGRERTE